MFLEQKVDSMAEIRTDFGLIPLFREVLVWVADIALAIRAVSESAAG